MNILLLLNAMEAVIISAFLFAKGLREIESKRIKYSIISLGFLYFSFAILQVLWFSNFTEYIAKDFNVIYTVTIIIQTIILLLILEFMVGDKRIFIILSIYPLILLSSVFVNELIKFFLPISFLLILLGFLNLISKISNRETGYIAAVYSSVSTILAILAIYFDGILLYFSVISGGLLFILLVVFLREFRSNTLLSDRESFHKEIPPVISFLKYFVFIIILTNFVFIGTVTVHEFGHLGMSKINGCEYSRIIYDGSSPHTETLCANSDKNWIVIMGGIFLPVIFALLLFFGGGKFIKEISSLIIGFNMILIYKDLMDLGVSKNISTFIYVLGGVFIILGILLLAKSRTNEPLFKFAE